MSNIVEYIKTINDQSVALTGKVNTAVSILGDIKKINFFQRQNPFLITIETTAVVTNSSNDKKQTSNEKDSKSRDWGADFSEILPDFKYLKKPLEGATKVLSVFWSATQKAISADKERVKMQILTDSEEIGNHLYSSLRKIAKNTVLGDSIYEMGTKMLQSGVEAPKLLSVVEQLGDISMGDVKSLDSLTSAFSKISEKGYLGTQELQTMISSGFNPLEVISQKTGESMDSLTKKMENGKITTSQVSDAMKTATSEGGTFYQALEKVGNTPYGQLEVLKGKLDDLFISIGDVFIPIASIFMTAISWIGECLGSVIGPLSVLLAGLSIGLLAVAAAQWAFNLAFLSNPITWVIAVVVALIGLIIYLVSRINGWGDAWKVVVNNARLNWEVFTSFIEYSWDLTINRFMIGIDKIKKGWYQFKNVFGIGNEIENNLAIQKINEDVETRKETIKKSEDKLAGSKLALKDLENATDKLKLKDKGDTSNFFDTFKSPKDKGLKGVLGAPQGDFGKNAVGTTSGRLSDSVNQKSEGIISGGNKVSSITININKLQDHTIINVDKTETGISNLGEKVQDLLLRAVNSVNQMQIG